MSSTRTVTQFATNVLGIPSPSVSVLAQASNGKSSDVSSIPSLSSSVSPLSPTPSPSLSTVSFPSSGNTSLASKTPSLSSSVSVLSQSPSPSESIQSGKDAVPRVGQSSTLSAYPSLSSSSSIIVPAGVTVGVAIVDNSVRVVATNAVLEVHV